MEHSQRNYLDLDFYEFMEDILYTTKINLDSEIYNSIIGIRSYWIKFNKDKIIFDELIYNILNKDKDNHNAIAKLVIKSVAFSNYSLLFSNQNRRF